jgi:rubrerythrin
MSNFGFVPGPVPPTATVEGGNTVHIIPVPERRSDGALGSPVSANTRKHWTLDDIPWGRFEPAEVDPLILAAVKAASLVEGNSGDYGEYLCNVFADDPEFQQAARDWAREEIQHGHALGRWARLADPGFDFEDARRHFTEGYRIPVASTASVRGSRAGELIARCVVETGTNSFYTSLAEATDEPVLKAICRRIAADELRHYKLFYSYMKRYLAREPLGVWARVKVVLGRLIESTDDELAYAYHAANGHGAYDRERNVRDHALRAFAHYRPHHIDRAVAMVLKAVGVTPNGWLGRVLSRLVFRFMQFRLRRLAAETR